MTQFTTFLQSHSVSTTLSTTAKLRRLDFCVTLALITLTTIAFAKTSPNRGFSQTVTSPQVEVIAHSN